MFAPRPLPRTLEASVRDLSSEKASVRASALVDLVRHASLDEGVRARAIPMLEKALSDAAAEVRSAAAVGLADVRGKEALPALLVAMEDVNVHTRQMAINALGEIGDVRAAPRLRRALADERPEVRYQSVIAMTRVIKDDADDVRAVLLVALGDPDDSIRYIALRLAEERLDQGDTKTTATLAERAMERLSDDARHVALAAAIFLAKLGNEAGRARVLLVIEGQAPSGKAEREDEREAVELAGVLGMREAIPALERRAWGVTRLVKDTCAWNAKIALARMGHARATDEILRDLSSTRKAQREAAVVAAGRARIAKARPAILAMTDLDAALVTDALAALDEPAR